MKNCASASPSTLKLGQVYCQLAAAEFNRTNQSSPLSGSNGHVHIIPTTATWKSSMLTWIHAKGPTAKCMVDLTWVTLSEALILRQRSSG